MTKSSVKADPDNKKMMELKINELENERKKEGKIKGKEKGRKRKRTEINLKKYEPMIDKPRISSSYPPIFSIKRPTTSGPAPPINDRTKIIYLFILYFNSF